MVEDGLCQGVEQAIYMDRAPNRAAFAGGRVQIPAFDFILKNQRTLRIVPKPGIRQIVRQWSPFVSLDEIRKTAPDRAAE